MADGFIKGMIRDMFAVKYNEEAHDPKSQKIDGAAQCYPNTDNSIWLRSCEKEIIAPLTGEQSGTIPSWLSGSLFRNGPGNWKVGDSTFQHLFDCSALLHKFSVKDGKVTYQTRFVETETLKRNRAAQRIVVSEFGTASVPDPCHSIFNKVSSVFRQDSMSDNSMITIYPFGDEFYAFGETPVIHRINPSTLATEGRLRLTDFVGIVSHTSHPHVMEDSTVYNLGLSVTKLGPAYNIICFPKGEHMFEDAYVVGTIPCRWKLNPGYMHTFGVTENYFVIVEQPMSVSLSEMIKATVSQSKFSACLKFFEQKPTYIYLMERKTGKLRYTFQSDAFFYLHIINQYEEDNHVILDICCYKDPSMIECMYLESMMNMQTNPNYAAMFRGKSLRFVMPLAAYSSGETVSKLVRSMSLANISNSFHKKVSTFKRSESNYEDFTELAPKQLKNKPNIEPINNKTAYGKKPQLVNLVTLSGTKSKAYRLLDGSIHLRPELLCNVGCETPRINYDKYLGKKYRYYYSIGCDVDSEHPGILIKVDTVNKETKTWYEHNVFPSEPIFVPSPDSTDEDDGVILSVLIWGGLYDNRVGLLVLCAKTMLEVGRAEFRTPSQVPKCLHGWFSPMV